VSDWRYIFDGLGRQKGGLNITDGTNPVTPTSPLGLYDSIWYRDGRNGNTLADAINSACGNTALKKDKSYWSCSRYWNGPGNQEWSYSIDKGQFGWVYNYGYFYVRACFAF